MPALVTLNVAGNDLRPPKGERPLLRGQRPPPKGERPSTKTGRRGRRDPAAAATGMRRTDAVANGPLPTFVVSADPSSRAVYTSPVLATPNGDLLYRPPLPPPSPAAKPGRRLGGFFRRKAATRDGGSDERAVPTAWSSSQRRHPDTETPSNDVGNSSNRQSASSTVQLAVQRV